MASEHVDISKSYEYKLGDKSIVTSNVLQENNSGFINTYLADLPQDDDGKILPIDLSMIEDKEMFTALMRLISEEDLGDLNDLTPKYFKWIFQAANYLCLDQELLNNFARSIFKKAFLGKHRNDIIRTFPYHSPSIGENISWAIFLAYLENSGCYIKRNEESDNIYIHSIPRSRLGGYESEATYESKPHIEKLILSAHNIFRIYGVNRDNKMAFLFWFIYQLKITSLVLDSYIDIKAKDIIKLTDVIRDAKKLAEDEDIPFSLELCELNFWQKENDKAFLDSLQELRKIHPKLKGIGLEASKATPDDTKLLFGFERLCLHEYVKDSEFIKMLLYNNPHLISLDIGADKLTEDCAKCFGTCTSLERLFLRGPQQDTTSIRALIPQIPRITALNLYIAKLEDDVGLKFKNCPNIQKIVLEGSHQETQFIFNLVSCIPSIKILSLWADLLDQNAAKAFETCKKLEKLEIKGDNKQNPDSVKTLISALPQSLEELTFKSQKLDFAVAEGFKNLVKLKKLHIHGDFQDSNFYVGLLSNIHQSIKDLYFRLQADTNEVLGVLERCERLESIEIFSHLPADFIRSFLSRSFMRSLRVVTIRNYNHILTDADKEAIRIARISFPNCEIDIAPGFTRIFQIIDDDSKELNHKNFSPL